MTSIPDATTLTLWRMSSYCENADGACLEVSDGSTDDTPVRDSKNPHGPAVIFPNTTWSAFVAAVKENRLP
ncbi:DUF397 domain-containing protein [Streptomyces odontomachi]|uniref:DUF397 domain-containing protein n=1 Tax=Streptomyces odontomachi TaxID=2944940 RepID=UPI00210BFB86|nr:DUF397 domain-containing protein [Streptomyces sp. ODS25]